VIEFTGELPPGATSSILKLPLGMYRAPAELIAERP
jgi:hypothetical protein